MTTSVLVAIYVLAGGDMTAQTTILGGTVNIERPYILEIAGASLFVYMFLRFLFPWENVQKPVLDRACRHLHRSKSFKDYVRSIGRQTNSEAKNVEFSGQQRSSDKDRKNAWRSPKGVWHSSITMTKETGSNTKKTTETITLDSAEVWKHLIWPYSMDSCYGGRGA